MDATTAEERPQTSAPSVRMPVAPAHPTTEPTEPAKAARTRTRRASNKAAKRGRPTKSDAEREAAAAARAQAQIEQAERQAQQAAAQQTLARSAAVAALTPDLVQRDEIQALGRFALAILSKPSVHQEQGR